MSTMTTDTDLILEARDVSLSFGGVKALTDVSLAVPAGGRLAVIGPNGAGKSTLINVLTGFLRPDAGTVTFRGEAPHSPVAVARRGLMRTFQNLELFDSMTVLENILVTFDGGRHRGAKPQGGARARALEVLKEFDLAGLADQVVGPMPYGIRKLVELTRVIAAAPDLVMLDEPVAGVANKAEYIETLIRALDELGSAVILVEHDMATVSRVADHVVVLESGRILATGTYAEVSANAQVIEAYLGTQA